MYTVEWQKKVFPHTHLFIWLLNKIEKTDIDILISADPNVENGLFDTVTTSMIYGSGSNME